MVDVSPVTDEVRDAIDTLNNALVPDGMVLIVRPRYPLGVVENDTYYVDQTAGLIPVGGK